MFVSNDFKGKLKKTMKRIEHHGGRRNRFGDDYSAWATRQFGSKSDFGQRAEAPTVKVIRSVPIEDFGPPR